MATKEFQPVICKDSARRVIMISTRLSDSPAGKIYRRWHDRVVTRMVKLPECTFDLELSRDDPVPIHAEIGVYFNLR